MGVILRRNKGAGEASVPIVPTEHNSLSGIQGGKAGEYYHLTKNVHDDVLEFADIAEDILENGVTMNHNDLQEIQGGAVDDDGGVIEAYHLTDLEFRQVQFLLANYDELVDLLSEEATE